MKKIRLIGVYDYTVVLTYISLVITLVGISLAIEGSFRSAVFCLALSGLCDMFDGKIARSKKESYRPGKDVWCADRFSVRLRLFWRVSGNDLLSDGSAWSTWLVLYRILYNLWSDPTGIFNVLEIERQQNEDGANHYYHGLPITTVAIVLPLIFVVQMVLNNTTFLVLLHVMLLTVGTLFVVDFKLRKPGNLVLTGIVVGVAVAVLLVIFNSKMMVPKMHFPRTSFGNG